MTNKSKRLTRKLRFYKKKQLVDIQAAFNCNNKPYYRLLTE